MRCIEIEELVHQIVDNEVSADQLLQFEQHIGNCKHCNLYWKQVLKLKSTVKSLAVAAPKHSDHMQENILTSLKLESKREKRRKNNFLLLGIAAVILPIGICVTFAINQNSQKSNTIATVKLDSIVGHYHNHATMDSKKLMSSKTRMAKKVMLDLVAMSKQAGFSVQEKHLQDFMLASSEIIEKDGQRIARLCYKTPNLSSSTCIDCYFSRSGTLQIAGLKEQEVDGKKVAVGSLAGNSVILFHSPTVDTVFISSLPQDKLMEMVTSSPKNLS